MLQVDLRGRTAIVTGGGTGIGRAISLGLGRCGANVVVDYSRSKDAAEQTAADVRDAGSAAIAVRCDVTRWADVQSLVQETVERFGGVDILVSNAGVAPPMCPTADLPEEAWDQTLAVNAKGVFLCCKAAIALLPDNRGRIINVSSISARSGGAVGGLPYAAAKAAVTNMTRNLAKELAPRGITVNGVAPGVIWTRIHEEGTPPEEYQALIERIPLRRDGQPDDIVGAVLLLASDDGAYITGETIEVNGGLLMT
jgi:3-oxoacyl-[acyl-carrier protein] reductase